MFNKSDFIHKASWKAKFILAGIASKVLILMGMSKHRMVRARRKRRIRRLQNK